MEHIMPITWDDVEKMYENGVFCPEAWTSLSSTTSGAWRMCCYATRFNDTIETSSPLEHMNYQGRKTVRLDMMDGTVTEQSPCSRCHHAEADGNVSRRNRMMDAWRKDETCKANILKVMNTTKPDGSIEPVWFDRVDVKFTGNKCNLRCFTCVPQSSSALAIESAKMGTLSEYGLTADFDSIQDPFGSISDERTVQFWEDFDVILPHTRILNFTGGEPFMIDAYWDMLDRAVNSGAAANMELHLSSNMTVIKYGKRSVMDYFGKFKKVRLQGSLDGTADYNHYIRYPSKFDTIMSNIHRVNATFDNVDIVVSAVVSALNVKNIPALYDFLKAEGIGFTYSNVLFAPLHQRIEWLPQQVKDLYLSREFDRPDAELLFGNLMSLLRKPGDPKHFEKLLSRCAALDKHRGTDFTKLWPEFISG